MEAKFTTTEYFSGMSEPQATYRHDSRPPFATRVYLEDFSNLDPLSIPWKELRRNPEKYPDWHVAKVSSLRTVVGFNYRVDNREEHRIYLKRSLLRGKVKQILSLFRASKEWREFQIAQEFARENVIVPRPVYYSEGFIENGLPQIFLATSAFSPSWRPSKEYFKETRRFDRVWESLAAYTKSLHDRKILHGDYRSDHLYFNEDRFEAEDYDRCWALIDLDGSRVGKVISSRDRFRALTQLTESLITSGISRENLKDFLAIYDHSDENQLDSKEIFKFVLEKVARKKSG